MRPKRNNTQGNQSKFPSRYVSGNALFLSNLSPLCETTLNNSLPGRLEPKIGKRANNIEHAGENTGVSLYTSHHFQCN